MNETIVPKIGNYNSVEDVLVTITQTVTKEETTVREISEALINQTIDTLEAKRTAINSEIDAEIAYNEGLLLKVQSANRESCL